MRIVSILLFLTSLYTNINGQGITRAKAKADMDYLHKYLSKWHPSYDRYHTEDQIDSMIQILKHQLPDSLTYRHIRIYVSKAVQFIGCGHTSVGFSSLAKVDSLPTILPLDVYVISDKLYIRNILFADSTRYKGAEILSINGLSASSIVDTMQLINVSEGYNTTHYDSRIEKYFSFFYRHLFGGVDHGEIEIMNLNGMTETIQIQSTSNLGSPNKYRRYQPDSTTIVFEGGGMALHHLPDVKDAMLLSVKSFGTGSQKSVRKKTFKYLKSKKIKHLIIDLRGNGGGNMFTGYKFLSYLLDEKIIGLNFGRMPSFMLFQPKLKLNWANRLTNLSFMLNPLQYPSKHGWMHLFPFLRKKNAFNGEIYVLTDGGTFSMASAVAAKLKNKRNAKIIGTETGGGAYGSAGMSEGKIILPNSKIPVSFNTYWTINRIGRKDVGHGVMPDYTSIVSIGDVLAGKDVDLIKALELIKNNQ